MQNAIDHSDYSDRVFDHILKVAKTIADLEEQIISPATISLKLSNIALWIENTRADSIKLYNLIP